MFYKNITLTEHNIDSVMTNIKKIMIKSYKTDAIYSL